MGLKIHDNVQTDFGFSQENMIASFAGNNDVRKEPDGKSWVSALATYYFDETEYAKESRRGLKHLQVRVELTSEQLPGDMWAILYADLASRYSSTSPV